MSIYKEKQGFTDHQTMWADVVTTLKENGFTVVSINGSTGAGAIINSDLTKFVLQATTAVDPLADDQPWRLCGQLTEDGIQLFCASPAQIADDGTVAIVGVTGASATLRTHYAGCLSGVYPELTTIPVEYKKDWFFHKGWVSGSQGWPGTAVYPSETRGSDDLGNEYNDYVARSLANTDWSAMPLTYALAISDHGIAFHMSIEGRDNEGCRQAWFCIQRAINSDGSVVVTGKAPLFAIWSHNGGGHFTNAKLVKDGIRRMTVRESDVNAPSSPVSAVQHSPDAFAVINPLQQVAFSEEGQFDFRLPQGFNTHRHSYPYEIDMIGYASSDVISNRIPIDITVYNESAARTYAAMSANSPNNTGMRLFLLKKGGGIA